MAYANNHLCMVTGVLLIIIVILLSNMYGKISRVVKARITRVPEARVQYGA